MRPSLLLAGAIELPARRMVAAEEHLPQGARALPEHLAARHAPRGDLSAPRAARQGGGGARARASRQAPQNPAVLRVAGEVALANNRSGRRRAKYYEQAAACAKDDASDPDAARRRCGSRPVTRIGGLKDLEAAVRDRRPSYQADLALIAAHLSQAEFDKAIAAVADRSRRSSPRARCTLQREGRDLSRERRSPRARARASRSALALQPDYLPAAPNLARLDIADKQPDDARKRFEAIVAKDAEERAGAARARRHPGGDRRAGEGGRSRRSSVR